MNHEHKRGYFGRAGYKCIFCSEPMSINKPDSPEEKRMTFDEACVAAREVYKKYMKDWEEYSKPETTHEKEIPYNQRDHSHCWNQTPPACGIQGTHAICCLCGIVNPKNDDCKPDFIEEATSLFREKFVRDDGLMDKYYTYGDAGMNNYEVTTAEAIEDFLKEKLTEAYNTGHLEATLDGQEKTMEAIKDGRLAMKERVEKVIIEKVNERRSIEILAMDLIVAIRNMK